MRSLLYYAVALPLLSMMPSAEAQTRSTCAQPSTFTFTAGQTLDVESRSGEIQIVGTPGAAARLTCTMNNPNDLTRVRVISGNSPHAYKLRISGGPSDNANFQLRLEVPQHTNLRLRASAGEVRIIGVDGDKEVRLTVGEITFAGITPVLYKSVSAAVTVGEVDIPSGFASKRAFFDAFSASAAQGKYDLRAHVMVGQINFNQNPQTSAQNTP